MDRYDEVKQVLKRWEQSFLKERHRKPNKEDIDEASDETRNLYKEYRNLKRARENKSDASGDQTATPAVRDTAKESDSWGVHLNRSALPAASPRLTVEDRDSLKASSQYYGFKLKTNLASLCKVRPATLKKSFLPGRQPRNCLKDEQTSTVKPGTPAKITSKGSETSPFSLRRFKPTLGCLASKMLDPAEPEEPFEPFEHVTRFSDESADSPRGKGGNFESGSATHRSSDLLSLSPEQTAGDFTRKLETTEKAPEGIQESPDVLKTPHRGLISLTPQTGFGRLNSHGGFGGAAVGRPSPASRLSLVDRKWLERCQVFGEMGGEEKPGGGNQEVKMEKRSEKDTEKDRKRGDAAEKVEITLNADGDGSAVIGQDENSVSTKRDNTISDRPPKSAQRLIGKGNRGDKDIQNQTEGEEVEKAQPTTQSEGETCPGSQGSKKKGKKRPREGEDTGGEVTQEGKRKQRRSKKEEESSDVNTEIAQGGTAKKRRTKKKDNAEDGESETDKEAKISRKIPQENLFGEVEEETTASRMPRVQSVRARVTKGAEGNFVKINLKKKSHVKGYALRGMALRRQLYVQKFQLKGERFGGGYFGRGRRGNFRNGISRQGDTCYKCGGTGHWAIDCKGRAPLPPVPEDNLAEEEPFELPTLEDVARATGTLGPQQLVPSFGAKEEPNQQGKEADGGLHDEVLLNVIRPDYKRPAPPPPVQPLYPLKDDGKVQETPDEVYTALRDLGYSSFRAGQEEAIMRILSGLSTLVVLSTGMGKSLCYQLPAYLYAQRARSITLVISPLVSLMDDQLSGVPAKLKAACIHSNMTLKQREAAIEKVKSGQVSVLILSPEALVGGGGSGSGCLPSAHELPPVAFACIDEAHCVSEWSHNFRPCYLRLCKVLRERLGVQCMLGLTATATMSTALDIAQHLNISDEDGIAVRSAAVPPNLNLSVSMDRDKDQALVTLLKGDRFGCLDSIIVYCTRREETVRVAALLRTCLQGVLVKENHQISSSSQSQNNPAAQIKKQLARKKIRKPLKWQAESYHAGLSGSERRRVQNNFMCGELRIVVATVAFGMGLDKSDVRGVIHYNMPKSFESYVQEIGRAGRDGEPAHCHLFLDPEGGDLHELRRHIYADTVDYYTVKRLVQKVFPPCKCKQIHQKQQELLVGVSDSELLQVMDECDQKGILNPSQDDKQAHKPELTTAQEISGLCPADQAPQEGREDGKNNEEEEKKAENGANWPEDWKAGDCDWPEERVCHSHERAIPIQETVEALDITEEGVETLLCYLELHPQRFIEILHPTLSVCKVSCYNGPRQIQKLIKICPPIAVVLARRRMAGERVETCDQLEFDVVEVADTMGWELPLVKRGLRQLQWSTDRAGGSSGVLVEFSSLSFYFRSFGDLSHDEMDRVCHFLHNRVQDQERMQLYQLTSCFKAFKSVAFQSVSSCLEDLDKTRSFQLKGLLSEYFDKRRGRDHTLQPVKLEEDDVHKILEWEDQIRADIRSFLANRSDEKFSGRAVARILHGIGSPCYPAQTYGKDRRYWRKYIHFDFNQLIRLATQEIICLK